MNHRLTHTLVGIVTAVLVSAAVAFGLVVTAHSRQGAEGPVVRSAIPAVAHPVDESMADCVQCHVPGRDGLLPNHATYSRATCLTCHRVAPDSTGSAKGS